MNEIEQYINRVCRHVGGSPSLRKHIREELLQHIQDMAEHYVGEGLTPEAAAHRALEDFGEPNEVGEGLEAVHGHSLISLVLEKSLEWKERTMKPVIVWNSLAHTVLLLLLAFTMLAVAFPLIFMLPKVYDILSQTGAPIPSHLRTVATWGGWLWNGWGFLLLGLGAAWAVFEWKCRVEYKASIRYCAIGIMSLAMVIVCSYIWVVATIPLTQALIRLGVK